MTIIWTNYVKYRGELRGFDLARVEYILRHAQERYLDTVTGRAIAIGRHGASLLMVPFEQDGDCITPVTVHTTSRQQISFRIKTGRFTHD